MDYKINENYLAILKYENSNKLVLDYVEIDDLFVQEKQEYTNLFYSNDNPIYNMEDLKKLLHYFLNNISLNMLSMEYKYCQDLSGTFEGFTVNVEDKIKDIKTSIEIIESIIDKDLSEYDDDNIGKLMNYCQQFLLCDECSLLLSKEGLADKAIEKITRRVINNVASNLNLWTKAYSIQKKYRECYDNKQILFFSHRIAGWASPVCKLDKELSAEYKTNFGYGRASYFYVKLFYKKIELIPFSDLVIYKYASFFEINQYTRKYELENEKWKPAMQFLAEAYNTLMISEDEFIQKYMFDELDKLTKGLTELLHNDHFKFGGGETLHFSVRYDINHIEISRKENEKIEITVLRAKKITNALDFIQKIKEYQHLVKIDTTISQIENFNKSMKTILDNELLNTENEIQELEISISKIRPVFFEMRDTIMEYHNKKNKIQDNLNLHRIQHKEQINDIKLDELEKQFSKQYPEYDGFKKKYDEVSKKYESKIDLLANRRSILKDLRTYKEKIITYFSNR